MPQSSESVKRSATSCATSRSRLQNVHLSSLHTDTLQLLCDRVDHFCGATNAKKLERIQCWALRFVFLDFNSDYATLLDRAGLPTLELARKREILVEVYKAVMHLSPPFMWDLFTPKLTNYNLRNSNQLYIPHSNTTKYGLRSFSAYGATLWKSPTGHIKSCGDLNSFKTCMKTWQDIPCKCSMCI